ncbi:hypothetical protein C2845_PM02G25560 [Panicum miliaceum]|uniref:Uncharacterized protein n=1 Tax=Panicum miliaceum TaxID=4540 RepID=A0A3L6S6B2_PANMI|nr:hypothetical protein C2845_PM02G25560 [Panicum miliaceum]
MANPEVSDSSSLPFSTRRSDLVSAAAWFLCTISLACSTPTCRALTPDGGRGRRARRRLLAEDFSAPCREDRFCVPCAAAFCDHCCGAHHRGQGRQEVVVRAEAAAAAEGAQVQAQPGAAQGPARSGDRDSFCVSCDAGFSSALRGHHVGHETFRVVVCEGLYCARCTDSEPWFHLFTGNQFALFMLVSPVDAAVRFTRHARMHARDYVLQASMQYADEAPDEYG